MQLVVATHVIPPWTVLTVGGDLDVVGAPELRSRVLELVATGEAHLILDLTGVDFVDSFGLGVVIGALKRVRLRDGALELVVPDARIRRVFEVVDLDRIFTLHETVDLAVGATA